MQTVDGGTVYWCTSNFCNWLTVSHGRHVEVQFLIFSHLRQSMNSWFISMTNPCTRLIRYWKSVYLWYSWIKVSFPGCEQSDDSSDSDSDDSVEEINKGYVRVQWVPSGKNDIIPENSVKYVFLYPIHDAKSVSLFNCRFKFWIVPFCLEM